MKISVEMWVPFRLGIRPSGPARAISGVDKVREHDWDNARLSVLLFRGEFNAAISDTLASYYGGTVDPPWRFFLYDEPRWELNESWSTWIPYAPTLVLRLSCYGTEWILM